MHYDSESLYALLPAIHRVRDAAQGEVLKELFTIIAEQLRAVEEDIDQLYDNLFIETCADWAVPYIGDLIGYRGLHGAQGTLRSSRAEVANTIAYRRRKGTAAVLEQLARDVTGWDAAAVEYFLRLATTQHLNHLRPAHACTADLGRMEPLERLGSAFDKLPRTADVRRIASGRGRHNIFNAGLFLWRLGSQSWTSVRPRPAVVGDARRFLFHPLAINVPLFTKPQTETAITHLAEPANVGLLLSRRELLRRPRDYYEPAKSFFIVRRIELPPGSLGPDIVPVPVEDIESCDLSDLDADPETSAWPAGHPTKVCVDPVLGRIRFPQDQTDVFVVFHHGFSAQLGGGEYGRLQTFAARPVAISVYPGAQPTLQATVEAQGSRGTVEITGSGPFIGETPALTCAVDAQLEIRGADHVRPTFLLGGDLVLGGASSSEITLNGLLLAGGRVVVPATISGNPNRLQKLRIVHCTLVPGLTLRRDREPVSPGAPSIVIECPDTELEVEWSICGGIRAVSTAVVRLRHSIIDATAPSHIAFSAPAPAENNAGAPLSAESCTIIGKVHSTTLLKISNCLIDAETRAGDGWAAPVIASRRQQGCVRFSYVPFSAVVPRRYRSHPQDAEEAACLRPQFVSSRYGHPAYAQLALPCPAAIWQGANDGAEVGAFHHLRQPQRESDLRTRLDEYLRFGLEAGIFHAT